MERVHLVPVSGLDSEANSLTGEEVDERFLKIENKLIQKRKDGIKKLEITMLKALSSMSEISPNVKNVQMYADNTPDNNDVTLVQSSSHRLDSDQENVDLDGIFNDTQTNSDDTLSSRIIMDMQINMRCNVLTQTRLNFSQSRNRRARFCVGGLKLFRTTSGEGGGVNQKYPQRSNRPDSFKWVYSSAFLAFLVQIF